MASLRANVLQALCQDTPRLWGLPDEDELEDDAMFYERTRAVHRLLTDNFGEESRESEWGAKWWQSSRVRHLLYTDEGEALLQDPEFVLEALRVYPLALVLAPPHLRKDVEFMARAAQIDGFAIMAFRGRAHVTDRQYRELCRAAVRTHGCAIQHCKDLDDDVELALEAIAQNPWAYIHLAKPLQSNVRVAVAAVSGDCRLLGEMHWGRGMAMPRHLRSNKAVLMAAIEHHPKAVRYLPKHTRKDREVIELAIQGGWWRALSYATKQMKKDPALVHEAFRRDPRSLRFASAALRNGGLAQYTLGILFKPATPTAFEPTAKRVKTSSPTIKDVGCTTVRLKIMEFLGKPVPEPGPGRIRCLEG